MRIEFGILGVALVLLGLTVFTGRLTDFAYIDVEINSNISGAIFVLDHQSSVKAYSPVNITMAFKNDGSVSYTSNVGITIEDFNRTIVYASYSGGQLSMDPGEERIFEAVYYPVVEGLYWVHANATFSTQTKNRFSLFVVDPLYPPSTGSGESGEGTPSTGPTPPIIPIGRADMKIFGDPEVTIAQGESWMVFFRVENTGEIPLQNIRLLGSAPFPFSVEPKLVSFLSPNYSVIYLAELHIPASLDIGDYRFDYSFTSQETTKRGQMIVHVRELSIRDEVWRTILNYQYLIAQLEGDISRAKDAGKDTQKVEELLEKAQAELRRAEQLFNLEEYFRARDQLVSVKDRIGEVVRHLAFLLTPDFSLRAFFDWLLLLIPLIAGILYYVIMRRRRAHREE